MNEPDSPTLTDRAEKAHALLCQAAELVTAHGVAFARAADPHAFATVPLVFDEGSIRRRLVLDYLPGGMVRIALLMVGTSEGTPQTAEMFATVMQGPAAEPQH